MLTVPARLLGEADRAAVVRLVNADPIGGAQVAERIAWGPARDVRPCQPLLMTRTAPALPADPTVRLVRSSEVDALLPAAVAMYAEEVGVSPLDAGGARDYRVRVADLVRARRAYAKFVR